MCRWRIVKLFDVAALESPGLAGAMQRHTRLYARHRGHLADESKPRVAMTVMPVIIGVTILFPLGNEQRIVNDGLPGMAHQVLHRRIQRCHLIQIFLDECRIQVDVDKGRKPRLLRSFQHPKARGLATRQINQARQRSGP
jgi:hypothetical protein